MTIDKSAIYDMFSKMCLFKSPIYASSIKFVKQTFDNVKKTLKIKTVNSWIS